MVFLSNAHLKPFNLVRNWNEIQVEKLRQHSQTLAASILLFGKGFGGNHRVPTAAFAFTEYTLDIFKTTLLGCKHSSAVRDTVLPRFEFGP